MLSNFKSFKKLTPKIKMTDANHQVLDARFHHPFTCIVSGPTQSGKSTFVKNLLLNHTEFVDSKFEYILIFIGTAIEDNPILHSVVKDSSWETKEFMPQMHIYNLKSLNYNKKDVDLCGEFVKKKIKNFNNKNGCIIFDDLMKELVDSDIISDCFTKLSSHNNVSIIFITQNIFHQAKSNMTLYRNTHILVLFRSPLDNTAVNVIASRMNPSDLHALKSMLFDIMKKYRYVVLRGDLKTSDEVRITSDIFATDPIPHQKVFSLG